VLVTLTGSPAARSSFFPDGRAEPGQPGDPRRAAKPPGLQRQRDLGRLKKETTRATNVPPSAPPIAVIIS